MQILKTGRILTAITLFISSNLLIAQDSIEWFTLGSDFAHTRYSPASEITAENFGELEVAWEWDGASFNASSGRSTPSYIDGKLFFDPVGFSSVVHLKCTQALSAIVRSEAKNRVRNGQRPVWRLWKSR